MNEAHDVHKNSGNLFWKLDLFVDSNKNRYRTEGLIFLVDTY